MIRVVLRGDLGNQLFQYAVGLHLARRHDVPLVLNIAHRLCLRDPFGAHVRGKLGHFAGTRAPGVRFERTLPALVRAAARLPKAASVRPYSEPRWGFVPEVLDLPDGTLLRGYFQAPQYFAAIAPELRAELRFVHAWPNADAQRLADTIDQSEAVAVHVRRGDYLRSPLHRVCTKAYYQRAMDLCRKRQTPPRFFVFSDDIAWCRAHLSVPDGCFVDPTVSAGDAPVDLRLMARCRHHIIANSTFSWWGAWLGARPGQQVVVPERWFNDPALDASAMRDTVPAAWQRMAVT